jgi:P2 family phage major capsid protein
MRDNTKQLFAAMSEAMAQTYGVPSVDKAFAATPTMEQRLVDAITLTSDFLSKINTPMVVQQTGEVIFGGVSGTVTSRTDTSTAAERVPKDTLSLNNMLYNCVKTEVDIAITYKQMDAWAKFADFESRIVNWALNQMALDMLAIGFTGTSVAATSTSLLDVNKGWLQVLKEGLPSNYLTQGATANQIKIGATGDYKNLDHMVSDIRNLVDEEYRDDGDLVAIIGRDLLANDKSRLYIAQGNTPTEKQRVEMAQTIQTYGGLPAYPVAKFPAKGLLITSFSNLSIYTQEGSVRRAMLDNPKKDRIEHYNSRNEAYVVERLGKAAAIEAANVVFV